MKRRETDEPRRKRATVEVEARVVRVVRSQTGLRAGDVIRISYVHSRYKRPMAGPSEVPILKQGETCPAYLSRDVKEKRYAPAAGGYASKMLDEAVSRSSEAAPSCSRPVTGTRNGPPPINGMHPTAKSAAVSARLGARSAAG